MRFSIGTNETRSFDLPQRISGSCIYPRKPSNGSTVIICAHTDGLRVIWYAGRKLKQSSPPTANGNTIDLTYDNEEDNLPEYEPEEQEVDPARPYHDVLDYQEIHFGTAVTKIAVPPPSLQAHHDFHKILETHAIIVAACADLTLRIVAIPLELVKQKDGGIQQFVISGNSSHQDLISDVAVTVTENSRGDDDARQAGSRPRGRDTNDIKTTTENPKNWSILIASTSSTGTGLLLVHQLPISHDGQLLNSAEYCVPIQRRFLRYPLARCHIEFNPSLYPSQRHSTLLVASADGAATKVYQTLPRMNNLKKRRGSAATIDSVGSTTQTSKRTSPSDKVLLNLLAPFNRTEDSSALPNRKRVLDAKWVLHGRAVMVLLDDGEWGVWDIEVAGPSSSTSTGNLVKAQSNISSLQGGSITRFAIRGNVATASQAKLSASSITKPNPDSSLAPMTPHTRKTRSEDLFLGRDQGNVTKSMPVELSKHGSVAVLVQSSSGASSRNQDESIVLSYGHSNTYIPSIQAYWRSDGADRGSFDGSAMARPVVLPRLRLAGEEQLSVHLMPRTTEYNRNGHFASTKIAQDFIVTTSSRLVLYVTPLPEAVSHGQGTSASTQSSTQIFANQDQMLLDSGELDVDGMDRILENMTHSDTLSKPVSTVPLNTLARKSVGFQLDSDDDEEDDTVTPVLSKGLRSKLTVNHNSSKPNGARRLFT